MVKFGLNGSDATIAAVRLAQAYTGRDVVAVCRRHSFFSTHDWFIVTTPMSAGIPAAERLTVQILPSGECANAQLKTWRILRNLRCCPWRAGQLAKAIHALQIREANAG
jgi:glutamate-1-semialdehyde aminotransferase